MKIAMIASARREKRERERRRKIIEGLYRCIGSPEIRLYLYTQEDRIVDIP